METVVSYPIVKSFLAGSISGTCSTLVFQPLDLLKTRIQVPSLAGSQGDGLFVVCRKVLQQEKVVGLWKGTVPSIARCVPGVGIYFSTLHILQSKLGSNKPSNMELVSMGAGARCLSGVVMLPFTVVKVRYESGQFNYGGVLKAIRGIYMTEGARGLYSGMAPTLFRDAPFSGLYLLFYTNAKKLMPTEQVHQSHRPLMHFCCGVVAGALASTVTQPADVIKTHVQLNPQKFSSVRLVIHHIYKTKGLAGFMTGIAPRTMRRTLMAALAWTVYEQVMRNLGLK